MAVIIATPSANIDSRGHLIMAVEGLGKIQIDSDQFFRLSEIYGSRKWTERAGISLLARK